MKIGDAVEITLEDGSIGEGYVISFDTETVCICQTERLDFGDMDVDIIVFAKQKDVKVVAG